jgi:hypothetical protein
MRFAFCEGNAGQPGRVDHARSEWPARRKIEKTTNLTAFFIRLKTLWILVSYHK